MKLLFVSDLHKSLKPFKGVDESGAVQWLLDLIDAERPDALLSAGDWDQVSEDDMRSITSRTELVTVYGNHENFPVIEGYSLRQGQILDLNGIRISGINGLISDEESKPYHISTSKVKRWVEKIKRRLGNDRLDILLAHQPPYLPELYPQMSYDTYAVFMMKVIEELKPILFLNGHMSGCYSYTVLSLGGVQVNYLRVESSQVYKCYGIIDINEGKMEVFRDGEPIFTTKIEGAPRNNAG